MRYVVTGAAGFIGSHLGEALQDRGDEVVGLDSFTDYYDPALKRLNARGLDVRDVDLAEDTLDFSGFDGVFHLAGQPGVRSFGDVFGLYVERNVLASQRLFEAAARDGVRVVFSSSSSVYGEAESYPTPEDAPPAPLSPYGITKLTCEQLLRAYARSFSLDAVVLRYFNAFGPRQRPDMAFTRIVTALADGTSFELFGDGESFDPDRGSYTSSGYVLIFGGWNNSLSVICRQEEHGAGRKASRTDTHVEQNRVYHFTITRRGGAIDWTVDGRPFLAWTDPEPLAGSGHEFLAVDDWEAELTFDHLKIRPAP